MNKPMKLNVFWFRRDLRLTDNKGLYHALSPGKPVLPLFIFDDHILEPLPNDDHRVTFIYDALMDINKRLKPFGKELLIKKGKPLDVFAGLVSDYDIEAVYSNEDHEPYGHRRDQEIAEMLSKQGIAFHQYLDHLITGKNEVLTAEGSPYKVFTPYSRAWKAILTDDHTTHFPSENHLNNFIGVPERPVSSLSEIGFNRYELKAPPQIIDQGLIRNYHATRDIPALDGTTRLGVHLRFGTISIRSLVKKALKWNETFLNELIWREFYAMILWQFPEVVNKAFKPAYDRIEWRNNEQEFEAWKNGCTGYPMVDAGMRQINATGYMHNRLRMVVASFLTKHLLIDWRWGEAYFAEKLFDFELSSNNGGWQWSAGTGCDAAPYFRIFNPATQQKKFDPQEQFISRWIPEHGSLQYPAPIVNHAEARERCLKVYKMALSA